MNEHLGAAYNRTNETSFHAVMWRLKEHFKMNCIRGNQPHIEGSDVRPINPPHPSHDQSHLMALTSEWGHSVFELHGARENPSCNQVKHPSEIHYKPPPIREEQNVSGLMRSTEAASFVTPVYGHRQDALTDYSISGPHFHIPEKIKEEDEEQNYNRYSAPKNGRPQQESLSEEDRPYTNPELPKANVFHQEEPSKPQSSDEAKSETRDSSPGRKLRIKHGKLSNEEILARRAAQAAAQREVRRRRREKLTPEELEAKLAALAAAQREARRRQRERMTEEELQLRRTLSAITQREIRKRKLSSMTEEELKEYRAREALRQKELRHRKRMLMSEEDLKMLKAKEAAASAARRARRLGKEIKGSYFTGEEPDPSPS